MKTTKEALLIGLEELTYQLSCAFDTQLDGYDVNHIDALKVEGNKLLRNGEQVALRGVSFAGWNANWEGVEALISSLVADTDFSQHINVVRMPVQLNAVHDLDFDEFIQNRMIPVVNLLNSHGFYVIIDDHQIVDWDRKSAQKACYRFWEKVAPVFRHNPKVLFEIINEPILPGGNDAQTYQSFVRDFQPIVNMVRSKAPHNIVIMGNPDWTSNAKYVLDYPIEGENIMYAYHIYPNMGNKSKGISAWLMEEIPENAPMFITEFGYSINAGHHADLSNDPYYREEMQDYFTKRPWTCWTAWNYDDASIPAFLSDNGADCKQWVQGLLNTPVDFTPPAPLPDINSLADLNGAVSVWDASQEVSFDKDINGLIFSFANQNWTSEATQDNVAKQPLFIQENYKRFVRFSGGQQLVVENTDPFFMSDSVSISVVFRINEFDSSDRRILHIEDSANGKIELILKGNTGKISAGVASSAGSFKWIHSQAPLSNDWVHVTLTFDNVTGRVILNVLGQESVSVMTAPSTPFFGSGILFSLGSNLFGSSGAKMDLHQMAIIDHKLSSDEISQIDEFVL